MDIKTIAIGSDHAGFSAKASVVNMLKKTGYTVLDCGTDSENSVDYPDFIHPVAEAVEMNKADVGIILCGSGNGAAMTANKHPGIRAALAWTKELAALGRQHNDANVLAIPARFVKKKRVKKMVTTFLATAFEGGRHQRRVDKIALQNSSFSKC